MDIEVTESCARTGYCVRVAPELFALEPDDDRASVRADADSADSEHLIEIALDAEATCPLGAIVVSVAEGVVG